MLFFHIFLTSRLVAGLIRGQGARRLGGHGCSLGADILTKTFSTSDERGREEKEEGEGGRRKKRGRGGKKEEGEGGREEE